MFRLGVRAYMRFAVLAAVLILAACSSPSKAQSSPQPSAAPTPILVTPSAPPAAAQLTWTAPMRIDHQPPFAGNAISAVSCPTKGLCVAVDEVGNVITSKNPSGGAGTWKVTEVDPGNALTAVSCPSAGLCVVLDGAGNVVTSSDPTGTAASWTVTPLGLDSSIHLSGVSCPSTGLCIVVNDLGDVVMSTNPTGGATDWSVRSVPSSGLSSVSCPSSDLCVAVGQDNVVTS